MDNQITIQKENVLSAYNQASQEQKTLLENMFGKDMFQPKDITERVKCIEDAIKVLGSSNQVVIDYFALCHAPLSEDIIAYAKLRVIAEALNEGWKPKFDGEEYRYYPWFYIYTQEEYDALSEEVKKACRVVCRSHYSSGAGGCVAYASAGYASSYSRSSGGSRIALKTRELAEYCGKQFIDIWTSFLFA